MELEMVSYRIQNLRRMKATVEIIKRILGMIIFFSMLPILFVYLWAYEKWEGGEIHEKYSN